jgi:hypothetical protein
MKSFRHRPCSEQRLSRLTLAVRQITLFSLSDVSKTSLLIALATISPTIHSSLLRAKRTIDITLVRMIPGRAISVHNLKTRFARSINRLLGMLDKFAVHNSLIISLCLKVLNLGVSRSLLEIAEIISMDSVATDFCPRLANCDEIKH